MTIDGHPCQSKFPLSKRNQFLIIYPSLSGLCMFLCVCEEDSLHVPHLSPSKYSLFPFRNEILEAFVHLHPSNFVQVASISSAFSLHFSSSRVVPEMEKPHITEIKVRMDCNGCVQKIKKALHGINGIYDLYIDFPQQKLTVIGCADPEKIVKAIKKTRKIATICAHSEQSDTPAQPSEPAPPEGGQSDPDSAESPPTETAEPAEPSKDPPLPENPAPETAPSPVAVDATVPQQVHEHGLKDVENTHTIHHFPNDYGYGYSHDYRNGWQRNNNSTGYNFRPEPTAYVTHSYNTYKPFPSISETHSNNTYRTSPSFSEHENFQSPPRQIHYSRGTEHYDDYHTRGNSGVNNITSIFSDENPNACRIV